MKTTTFLATISLVCVATPVLAETNGTGLAAAPATNVVSCRAIGNDIIVLGELGAPFGTTVTITISNRDDRTGCFRVKEVNGKKHPWPILIDGFEAWPKELAATLEGFEYGEIRPASDWVYEGNACFFEGMDKRQYVRTRFRVLRIREPLGIDPGNTTNVTWDSMWPPTAEGVRAMVEKARLMKR